MPVIRFALAALVLLAVASPSVAQEKGRKVAFLVGVGKFKHDLADLHGSPQKDVAELGKVLKQGGFEVFTLTDKDATKDAIEKRFRAVVDGGANPAGSLGKGDVLLVAVCTHGFSLPPGPGKPEEPFVAGHDAKSGEPATMVSLNALIDAPKKSGATCLFLVDACREEVDANRGATRGVEPTKATLPKGTAVLFACGRGQLSHQSDKAGGHGLFTFAVLKTLRPAAGGKVSWNRLVAGVEAEFDSAEFKAMIPPGRSQTPVLASGELASTALLELAPTKPADGDGTKPAEKADPPPAGALRAGGKAALKVTVTKVYRDDKTDDYLTSVDSLPKGTAVEVVELKADRARVKWGGGSGWVSKDALEPRDR